MLLMHGHPLAAYTHIVEFVVILQLCDAAGVLQTKVVPTTGPTMFSRSGMNASSDLSDLICVGYLAGGWRELADYARF